MTTATYDKRLGIGPAELREYLLLLRDNAIDYAAAARRMEEIAAKIEASDWQFAPDGPEYIAAIEAQISRAFSLLPGGDDPQAPNVICDAIQDAMDVLTFAIERDDDAR